MSQGDPARIMTTTRRPTMDDELFFKNYNQGWTAPSDDTSSTPLPNIFCQYHKAILRTLDQQRTYGETSSISVVAQQLLRNLPPAALTQNIRVGTSTSCGCTCGQHVRDDLREFLSDLDRAAGNAEAPTQQRGLPANSPLNGRRATTQLEIRSLQH
ncbi:hypothetical protein CC86DRAFT_407177 [Ophiobolus disseminans]|uniref:Uncharacterized protein n=1 Tax=Ophiobolus disseminans TaxID=1469910 RepID=A0A6A7A034_9PLEO|nr:hypothetical protein CC86DRAFT_407177 [Ophiobolus disseminans]